MIKRANQPVETFYLKTFWHIIMCNFIRQMTVQKIKLVNNLKKQSVNEVIGLAVNVSGRGYSLKHYVL